MDRRKAREHAFTIIFQYKFRPDDMEEILSDFYEENDAGDQKEYIDGVVYGVLKNISEIDGKITECAKDWTVERIGVYEVLFSNDIPDPVAINEAVNLTRKFAGPETVDFVNGILGNIKK